MTKLLGKDLFDSEAKIYEKNSKFQNEEKKPIFFDLKIEKNDEWQENFLLFGQFRRCGKAFGSKQKKSDFRIQKLNFERWKTKKESGRKINTILKI